MKVINAFATPIALRRFRRASEINDRLHQIICEMAVQAPSDDAGRAHKGGWYSRGGFLARPEPEVKILADYFRRSLRDYLAAILSEEAAKAKQLNFHTWVAITRSGDYQTPHVHPQSQISGVYYVRVPKGVKKPQGTLSLMTPVGEQELGFFKEISATNMQIEPNAGDLVIFPSYLRHYTHPFYGDEERSVVVFTANCF